MLIPTSSFVPSFTTTAIEPVAALSLGNIRPIQMVLGNVASGVASVAASLALQSYLSHTRRMCGVKHAASPLKSMPGTRNLVISVAVVEAVAVFCNLLCQGDKLNPVPLIGSVLALRGGESSSYNALRLGEKAFTSDGKFDIGRVRIRLEGLQAYCTISALLMNACLRLYSGAKAPAETEGRVVNSIFDAFMVCCIVSVLLGAYTTVVFAMVSLYSKQAIGRGLDSNFLNFYEATHFFRMSAFKSFVCSLVTFQFAFVGSLYLNLTGKRRKVFGVIATSISILTIWIWRMVMQLATKFIFS